MSTSPGHTSPAKATTIGDRKRALRRIAVAALFAANLATVPLGIMPTADAVGSRALAALAPVAINPQPLPPSLAINPQPLPPHGLPLPTINPQPLPPGRD
jgi:hypothetical protein